jgi:RNA polymerase sigma-70 factor (ECF subfamily)
VIVRREAGHDAAESQVGDANVKRLIDGHFDFVWRLLRRLGLTSADADDATQQVFIVAARRARSIEPGHERTFLYGTALRVLANARRGARRRREIADDTLGEVPSGAPSPDERLESARARAWLDELLAELPPELARVLILAEIEGVSVPEIAALEGLPVGTAASRLRRARQAFRELLAANQDRNPLARGER